MTNLPSGARVLQADEGRQFNIMGSRMIYKVTSEDTGGAYSLAIETTPAKGGIARHVHNREDEAMLILEGEYEIECGEALIRATAGTFVFLPREVPNRYTNVGAVPGRFVHIVSPSGFEGLIAEASALMAGSDPDPQKLMEVNKRHGVEFI